MRSSVYCWSFVALSLTSSDCCNSWLWSHLSRIDTVHLLLSLKQSYFSQKEWFLIIICSNPAHFRNNERRRQGRISENFLNLADDATTIPVVLGKAIYGQRSTHVLAHMWNAPLITEVSTASVSLLSSATIVGMLYFSGWNCHRPTDAWFLA